MCCRGVELLLFCVRFRVLLSFFFSFFFPLVGVGENFFFCFNWSVGGGGEGERGVPSSSQCLEASFVTFWLWSVTEFG